MKKESKFFSTVSSRLALWYAVLFAAAYLISFMAVHIILSSTLTKRMDNDLLAELREFEMLYRTSGIESIRTLIVQEAEAEGIDRVFIMVTSPGKEIIASSNMNGWKDIPPSAGVPVSMEGAYYETFPSKAHPDGIRMAHRVMGDGNVITIGMDMGGDMAILDAFTEVSLTAMVLALIVGAVTGWYVSRKAMLGVERVRLTASGIGSGNISSRVPLGHEGEEIRNLANTFNSMLDRIESLIANLKEVTNNIAHELRSPLTRIRNATENILSEDMDRPRRQDAAAMVIEECDHMAGIINTMLEIAETDAGIIRIAREQLDLGDLIRKAHELFGVVAEDNGVSFDIEVPPEALFIEGDTVRLQRCISNLLDNALKFTPRGGRVTISARRLSDRLEMVVRDTGEGIAQEDLPHIFEKFYRSDKSRSTPGNGLGLSLVQSFVKAHHGEITVHSRTGEGTAFTIILPIAS
ncbi:MAG TPA: ATP-binding protein [Deltaproteobacteria bacterium]|nr:ATP-binding protein [Deltaproteobacteria bacterium]HQI80704.1 ATP-binding protein [Deltaproteobacteria bacterium]